MAIPSSISNYLERHGVRYSVVEHPVAYTAQEEAAVTHVPGREWAKAVVCMVDNQPTLAVLPADFLVDLERFRTVCGATSVRLASEAELRPLYADCELGAMPPLGPLYEQPVLVDKTLTSDPEIVFNAGSHHEAIRMRYQDFEDLVKPTIAEFAVAVRSPLTGT
jgi:Ala-tRNA(Pro) deacylase